MTPKPPNPVVDGYMYSHGPFTCTFRRFGVGGRWLIVVNDPRSGHEVFRTVPVSARTEAYCVASDWCDLLSGRTSLASALLRNSRRFEVEGNVLRTRPSVSSISNRSAAMSRAACRRRALMS